MSTVKDMFGDDWEFEDRRVEDGKLYRKKVTKGGTIIRSELSPKYWNVDGTHKPEAEIPQYEAPEIKLIKAIAKKVGMTQQEIDDILRR